MSKIVDWVIDPIHSRNMTIIILFLFSIIIIILAVYGGVRICTLQEKFDTIKIQQTEIIELKEKIQWLRQVNDLSLVLEQVLTPLQIDELKMLNERIRQNKFKELTK